MASFSSLTRPISESSLIALKLGDQSSNLLGFPKHFVFSRHGFCSFPPGLVKIQLKPSLAIKNSYQTKSSTKTESTVLSEVPILSCSEAIERLRTSRETYKSKEQYLAMYSSVFGGITTDPSAMVIPMDDHMVHRGHGVFDTAAIMDGYLYELDQHLDRFIRSATTAKIKLPFDRDSIRRILIQTFAVMKSVNYLPNALSKMEAEENGAYAAIWLDFDGFIAEGPNMNVAFVTKQKELLMPEFDKILSGCTARRALVLAESLVREGILQNIRVDKVTVEEGKNAVEMMLIGSGVLIRSVVQWDEQVIGNGKEGPVSQALLKLILEDMKSGPASVRVPVPY
ncbi:D-amino-acid transaminase, chloroplastic isoform X2 [Coffea eugenioides]|uniref:D-amino-acid transaminase, chloroplastic isoform X2 n=1 Tax=Coffea eugenioides TaxID=49369 RepID=UPI000F607401|nr:D-amino-acid transaminase, chloroplastic isoform X2 [Coffea eugenioides]